jgi:hypothetical protein
MLRLLYAEDGGSGFLRNTDTCTPKYMASLFCSEDEAAATSETLVFFYQLQYVSSTQKTAASHS